MILFKNSTAGLAFLACLSMAFAMSFSSFTTAACACSNAPANVAKTFQSSSSVAFTWDAAAGATAYEVWYQRQGDGFTSTPSTVTSTAASFTGLPAGRYVFYGRTVCGNDRSETVIFEDLIIG
jgi:hypothetical protein